MNKANAKTNAKKMYPPPPVMAFGKRLSSPSPAKSPSNGTSPNGFNNPPLKSTQSPIDPTKRNFKISIGQSAVDFNTTRSLSSQSPSSVNTTVVNNNKAVQSPSSSSRSASSILNKATERKSKDVDIQTELILQSDAEIEILTLTEIAAIQRERDDLEAMVQQSIDSALQMKEKYDAVIQDRDQLATKLQSLTDSNFTLSSEIDELRAYITALEATKGIAPSQGYEESKHASITASNAVNTTAESLSHIAATIQELDTQSRAMEGRLIEEIRSVAMKALDHLVEADAEDAAMKELFPSLIFERKEKEIDPYKVNVKAEKQRKKAEAAGVKKGFLFGSPSKRYPLSPGDHLASDTTTHDDDVDEEEEKEGDVMVSETIIEEDDEEVEEQEQGEYEDDIAIDSSTVEDNYIIDHGEQEEVDEKEDDGDDDNDHPFLINVR